jgi:hypothetical protein
MIERPENGCPGQAPSFQAPESYNELCRRVCIHCREGWPIVRSSFKAHTSWHDVYERDRNEKIVRMCMAPSVEQWVEMRTLPLEKQIRQLSDDLVQASADRARMLAALGERTRLIDTLALRIRQLNSLARGLDTLINP